MSVPLMLGGIPIALHAGAPELSDEEIGGQTDVRLSNGDLVSMERWKKAAGVISGQGWMPPGLDGLDFSGPLELLSTQVCNMQQTSLVFNLPSTPRPDAAPWAFALVGNDWLPAEVSTVAGVATVTPVAGATAYQVWWMPVYQVKAKRPPKTQSSSSATHGWSIVWAEV